MGRLEAKVAELCRELKISRATLYRYVGPDGTLCQRGWEVLQM